MSTEPKSIKIQKELLCHENKLRAWLSNKFELRHNLDDIIQESYIRVMRTMESSPLENPKAYLFAVARNLSIAHLKKEALFQNEEFGEKSKIVLFDTAKSSYQNAAYKDEVHLLRKAIKSLPKECRKIFVLRRIKGCSRDEIAQKMGISKRTVSAQLTIGLNKCIQFMNQRKYQS